MTTKVNNKEIERIWNILKTIPDPELHISLVDLGLIYDVSVQSDVVTITMTLTTIGCPLFGIIQKQVEDALEGSGYRVLVNLTFEPPWTMDRMSDEARMKLGLV